MKSIAFVLVLVVAMAIISCPARADGEEPAQEDNIVATEESAPKEPVQASAPTSEEVISQLLAQIQELSDQVRALSDEITALQESNQPTEDYFSIGVMPVQGAEKISGIGDSFRVMLVSALKEAGINAAESMDEELLHWIQRQDQLVREGLIDPRSAPRIGHLQGVNYYLLATVTSCDVTERDEEWGPITIQISNVRTRHASLRVDLRLIEVASGMIVDSFPISAEAEERTGPVLFDNSYDPREIEVIVTEKALVLMVAHVSEFFGLAPKEELTK